MTRITNTGMLLFQMQGFGLKVVRQLRKDLGLVQKIIEGRANFPKGWCSKHEKGECGFRLADIILMTDAMGIHLLTLFVRLMRHTGDLDTLPDDLRHSLEEFERNDVRRVRDENSHIQERLC